MEIYQDENLIVVEKPSGISTLKEGNIKEAFEDILLEKYSFLKGIERSGIVHRLDKDTSGILLVAKNTKSLLFFQKQFKSRSIEKEYICLVSGNVKRDSGKIEAFIGRSKGNYKKQKAYSIFNKTESAREAITEYFVLERFENYTLLRVLPKTGRKHQIRCHLSYIGHSILGDKLYGFKNSLLKGLDRLFLHASYIKVELPSKEIKEFNSKLPKELENLLNNLN